MTRNPYAPPRAQLEEAPKQPARPSKLFWIRFYLSPVGRTGRLFYWLFGLLPLVFIGLGFGLVVWRTQDGFRYYLTVAILLFWPQVVILARRLHDVNLTGWWAALFWVAPLPPVLLHAPLPPGTGNLVGLLAAIVLGFLPSTEGPNRYGNEPSSKGDIARPQTNVPVGT